MASLPHSLPVALKEWAIVCGALASGRQMLLLRKGGIHDDEGVFRVEHESFLLFPTYLHQSLKMLKAADQAGFEQRSAEPKTVTVSAAGMVTDVVKVGSRGAMDRLDAEHVWTPPLIDMRFNYKPANPLYLLLVRVYTLPTPVAIENTPLYAGCKSWVPLEQQVSTAGAKASLGDKEYARRREFILGGLSAPSPTGRGLG